MVMQAPETATSGCGLTRRAGFTLLIAALLPALRKARSAARRAVCASNLRQSGVAYWAYATEFNDSLPLAGSYGHYYSGTFLYLGTIRVPLGHGLLYPYLNQNAEVLFCPDHFSTAGATDLDNPKAAAASFVQAVQTSANVSITSTYVAPWYNGYGTSPSPYLLWYVTIDPSPNPAPLSSPSGLMLGGKLNRNISSPILGGKTAWLLTCRQYWYYNAVPLYSGEGCHNAEGSNVLYADGSVRYFGFPFREKLSIPTKLWQPQTEMLAR